MAKRKEGTRSARPGFVRLRGAGLLLALRLPVPPVLAVVGLVRIVEVVEVLSWGCAGSYSSVVTVVVLLMIFFSFGISLSFPPISARPDEDAEMDVPAPGAPARIS